MRTDVLLTARMSLPGTSYPKNDNVVAFFDRFLERLRSLPGVESASAIFPLPLSGSNMVTDFDIEQHPLPRGQRPDAPVHIIATDYFKTMGIPVKSGRVFSNADQLNSQPVVIVNERFVNKFFAGQNVLASESGRDSAWTMRTRERCGDRRRCWQRETSVAKE